VRILVTGKEGQVARCLQERLSVGNEEALSFVARPEFDLQNVDSIRASIHAARPDVVINTAAWTAVDQAEDEPDAAFAANAVAPGIMAECCADMGATLIHFSTDYVYPGLGIDAYVETDATGPANVYGASKLAGEDAVRATGCRNVILRTSWVYSPFGKNFVKTMIALAATRPVISVVSDQIGNPTSAPDIADAVAVILDHWRGTASTTGLGEVFHLAGTGHASWFDLASHVLGHHAALGGPSVEVRPTTTAAFPTKAVRPANSRLNCSKFTHVFGHAMPEWRGSAAAFVARLHAQS
jgi:dTDP-4-dehydrorhamnose reductase